MLPAIDETHPPRGGCGGRKLGAAVLAVLVAFAAACEVTPDKIARWASTESGPSKLRAVLGDASVKADLRAQAAEELVHLGMLAEVEQDVEAEAPPVRAATMAALVPRLWRVAQADDRVGQAPTLDQVKAKDALYRLRSDAVLAQREAIDADLAAWVCADLSGRAQAGGYGSAEILSAIGPTAERAVVQLLESRARRADALLGAQLLGAIGDDAARDEGARAVIRQIEPGVPPAAGRRSPPDPTLLEELGYLGGPVATATLDRLASPPAAGESRSLDVRLAALNALRERSDPASLELAFAIAGDGAEPSSLRDAAFALAQKIGGAGALEGALRLLARPGSDDDTYLWEAAGTALGAASVEALPRILDALPQDRPYPRKDLEDLLYAPILSRFGAFAVPALRRELDARSWVARLAAVDLLADLGGESDVPLLAALASDATKLRGWENGATLGREATEAAARLSRRL